MFKLQFVRAASHRIRLHLVEAFPLLYLSCLFSGMFLSGDHFVLSCITYSPVSDYPIPPSGDSCFLLDRMCRS